ncbi:7-cyano-7-deazaguanine synthase QueC [Fretibacter rubidus]|uniref:7-cyano-7-deazaguanine synthase QueC n=1 Tax=Fretibacter rubidus TaxID=570162 RepID=UPI00352B26E9
MSDAAIDRPKKALIMFSGGQDSATCLAWALERYAHVETVGFDYDQRHSVEMQCRDTVLSRFKTDFPKWSNKLGEDHLVDLSALGQISETSLTRDVEIEINETGLPSTFVPGRNLIFLNFAAAIGYRRGAHTLIGGMCEADFSGYPDCRKDTLDAQMRAISLGMDVPFTLETPLMHLSKAGAWAVAHVLGGDALVELILEDTHTCYKGVRDGRFDWGYGCGTCPACDLRAKGWADYSRGL